MAVQIVLESVYLAHDIQQVRKILYAGGIIQELLPFREQHIQEDGP